MNEQFMDRIKNYIKQYKLIWFTLFVIGMIAISGFYKCPLVLFIGVPCPCCGFSRAMQSLLKLDFANSFSCHPLWPVLIIAVLGFILYDMGIIRLSKKQFDICVGILACALIICYVIRHIIGSPIVEIHFEESLLGHLFQII